MRTLDVRKDLKTVVMVGVVLLLANAAVYAFLVRPRVNAFRDLEGSGDMFKKELAEAQKSVKTLSDYYALLETTQGNIREFYERILGTKQEKLVTVQQEIVEIGSEYRINPDVVSIENKEMDQGGLEEFKINALVVVDEERRVVGALNIHDLLRARVV